MPIVIFPRLLLQLLSLVVLAAGAYLVWSWFHGYDVADAAGVLHHRHPADRRLWIGVGLLVWSLGVGRLLVLLLLIPGGHTPMTARTAGREVAAPDGSRLHVETSGLATGPTVVLTHGWGLNSTAWGDLRQSLGARYRVVVWDLPGLGKSKGPADGVYTLDRFAQALGAVAESTGAERVLLVGHSIGGMTTQTLFRAAPEAARRVAGVVLVDTTHQDPARTMILSGVWTALQKPLIEPLMKLAVPLSPLLWLSSWQGYLSGSNQIVMRLTGFGRFATRGQVDLTARLAAQGPPAVQAKGNLAMLNWRVTDDLPAVSPPVLVLAGGHDIVTLPSASREIVARLPAGRLVEVEGAGHMGFLEAHGRYGEEIDAFAAQVLHPPAPAA